MNDSQVIPYLYYRDAGDAVDFMVNAFGFDVDYLFRDPASNRVMHATVNAGSGTLFVGPGMTEFGTRATPDPAQVASMTFVFVRDVDAHFRRANAEGIIVLAEPHEHFNGNRQYTCSDPGGQRWTFAQRPAS